MDDAEYYMLRGTGTFIYNTNMVGANVKQNGCSCNHDNMGMYNH